VQPLGVQPLGGGYPGVQAVQIGVQSAGYLGVYGAQPVTVVQPCVSMFQVPTTFQVKRNFFAYGGEMDILMDGMPYFRCVATGSPLGFGHVFTLMDLVGNTLCNIVPDISFGLPHFHIYRSGSLYATLKQDWNRHEKKFELHNKQTGEHVKVYGDWFGQTFEFQRHHGAQVAQVSSSSSSGNHYSVVVYPGEDALFILAATLVIEKVCHEHQHHHKHSW